MRNNNAHHDATDENQHQPDDNHTKPPARGEAAQRAPLLAQPLQPVPTWGDRLSARRTGSETVLNQYSRKVPRSSPIAPALPLK